MQRDGKGAMKGPKRIIPSFKRKENSKRAKEEWTTTNRRKKNKKEEKHTMATGIPNLANAAINLASIRERTRKDLTDLLDSVCLLIIV